MQQFNWTYVAHDGEQFHVGLLHGAKTGHVLIICNSSILLIDFFVLQDKVYPFFLGDQLCEIVIKRHKDRFTYHFEVNKKANTPLNNARRIKERKHWWYSAAAMGVIVILAVGLMSGMQYLKNQQLAEERANILAIKNKISVAQVTAVHEDGASVMIQTGLEKRLVTFNKEELPPMDVFVGDEFSIKEGRVQWEAPGQIVLKRWLQEASLAEGKHHVEQPNVISDCVAQVAWETKGVEGLATVARQGMSKSDAKAYQQWKKEGLVKEWLSDCSKGQQ